MIKYFISFTYKDGCGFTGMSTKREIKDIDDIINMANEIEKVHGHKDVVIMNIQRFPI